MWINNSRPTDDRIHQIFNYIPELRATGLDDLSNLMVKSRQISDDFRVAQSPVNFILTPLK